MNINKILILIAIIFSIGCSNRENDKAKENTKFLQHKKLQEEIDLLATNTNTDSIKKLKNKLDSILKIKENINFGYYYFRRAECYTSLELFKEANLDLEKAKKLNYLPERCNYLIKFNEDLQKIKNSYN